MGRMDDAIRAGERGVALTPISRDAYIGPYVQHLLARVQMMVGNHDEAVELLANPWFQRLVEGKR